MATTGSGDRRGRAGGAPGTVQMIGLGALFVVGFAAGFLIAPLWKKSGDGRTDDAPRTT
jgi:hypothetical protein